MWLQNEKKLKRYNLQAEGVLEETESLVYLGNNKEEILRRMCNGGGGEGDGKFYLLWESGKTQGYRDTRIEITWWIK